MINTLIHDRLLEFTPLDGVPYKKLYHEILRDEEVKAHADAYRSQSGVNIFSPNDNLYLAYVRKYILEDLFFVVHFVLGAPDNDPFVVERCKNIEDDVAIFEGGGCSEFEDIWARGHYKSTSITMCSTIQSVLKEKEKATCIFSFKKTNAEKFLESIMSVFDMDEVKHAFPDVLWDDTNKAKSWSVQRGIVVIRDSNRKEKTIETSGLVEGMPTGMHYDRLIFDDIETDDIADNVSQLKKAFRKFQQALNLGMIGRNSRTLIRVIGTPYSHLGPIVRIRDFQDIDGQIMYSSRVISAVDGDGTSIFLSEPELKKRKALDNYRAQYLCDPTPTESAPFTGRDLLDIEPEKIPENVIKYLIVDPAGDMRDQGDGDAWAIMVVGVEPMDDENGMPNMYICDMKLRPMEEEQAVKEIINMYTSNGFIQCLAIEQVNSGILKTHVADILRRIHRIDLREADNTLMPLKPQGRNKITRIRTALGLAFQAHKIFISESIPVSYRDRIRQEMDKFPVWHDDGLDALSWTRDVMDRTGFKWKVRRNRLKVMNGNTYGLDLIRAGDSGSWMGG